MDWPKWIGPSSSLTSSPFSPNSYPNFTCLTVLLPVSCRGHSYLLSPLPWSSGSLQMLQGQHLEHSPVGVLSCSGLCCQHGSSQLAPPEACSVPQSPTHPKGLHLASSFDVLSICLLEWRHLQWCGKASSAEYLQCGASLPAPRPSS